MRAKVIFTVAISIFIGLTHHLEAREEVSRPESEIVTLKYQTNIRIQDGVGVIDLSGEAYQKMEPSSDPIVSFGRFFKAGISNDIIALRRLSGPNHQGIGLAKSIAGGFNSLSEKDAKDLDLVRRGFSGFKDNNIYVSKVFYIDDLDRVYLTVGEWNRSESKLVGLLLTGWRMVKIDGVWVLDDAGGRHFMSEIPSVLLDRIMSSDRQLERAEYFEVNKFLPDVN